MKVSSKSTICKILTVLTLLPMFMGFISIDDKRQDQASLVNGVLSQTQDVLYSVGYLIDTSSLTTLIAAVEDAVEQMEDGTLTLYEYNGLMGMLLALYTELIELLTPVLGAGASAAGFLDDVGSFFGMNTGLSSSYTSWLEELFEIADSLSYSYYASGVIMLLMVVAVILCFMNKKNAEVFLVAVQGLGLVFAFMEADSTSDLFGSNGFATHMMVYAGVACAVGALLQSKKTVEVVANSGATAQPVVNPVAPTPTVANGQVAQSMQSPAPVENNPYGQGQNPYATTNVTPPMVETPVAVAATAPPTMVETPVAVAATPPPPMVETPVAVAATPPPPMVETPVAVAATPPTPVVAAPVVVAATPPTPVVAAPVVVAATPPTPVAVTAVKEVYLNFCSACGTKNESGDPFCQNCGNSLKGT
ncbi:MAG: hypothetical protein R3Y63_03160 [Eubacteriales bacterium]